jgi:hypothetical protein
LDRDHVMFISHVLAIAHFSREFPNQPSHGYRRLLQVV